MRALLAGTVFLGLAASALATDGSCPADAGPINCKACRSGQQLADVRLSATWTNTDRFRLHFVAMLQYMSAFPLTDLQGNKVVHNFDQYWLLSNCSSSDLEPCSIRAVRPITRRVSMQPVAHPLVFCACGAVPDRG